MNRPLITVIVPVYKVEQYLERCVDSLRKQTYQNLEIILVDDGSPDNSGKMCDALATQDARIRVIHKENGGLSSARNAGLDIAHGEYVGFVDSDDWVTLDMYEHLFTLMHENGAQIGAGGIQTGENRYFNQDYPAHKEVETFSRIDALREITRNEKITNSFCDKLWDIRIFDTVRFPVGEVYEDMKTIPKCLELVSAVVYDPRPVYYFDQSGQSITRGKFRETMFEEVYAAKARVAYYAEKYPEIYDAAVTDYIRTSIAKIWASRGAVSCTQKRKELIREMKGPLPSKAISLLRKNARVKLYALRFGLPVFAVLMTAVDVRDTLRERRRVR